MNKDIEIVREIITVASILIKFSREDIVEDRANFIGFLNEIGIKKDGRQLNQNSFRKLITNLTAEEKKTLISEFNEGFENIYRHLTMYSNYLARPNILAAWLHIAAKRSSFNTSDPLYQYIETVPAYMLSKLK